MDHVDEAEFDRNIKHRCVPRNPEEMATYAALHAGAISGHPLHSQFHFQFRLTVRSPEAGQTHSPCGGCPPARSWTEDDIIRMTFDMIFDVVSVGFFWHDGAGAYNPPSSDWDPLGPSGVLVPAPGVGGRKGGRLIHLVLHSGVLFGFAVRPSDPSWPLHWHGPIFDARRGGYSLIGGALAPARDYVAPPFALTPCPVLYLWLGLVLNQREVLNPLE